MRLVLSGGSNNLEARIIRRREPRPPVFFSSSQKVSVSSAASSLLGQHKTVKDKHETLTVSEFDVALIWFNALC